MESNLIDLKKEINKKAEKAHLDDFLTVMKLTKKFYEDLKPYFKYRVVYGLAKNILDFRDDLAYNIKMLQDRVKKDTNE